MPSYDEHKRKIRAHLNPESTMEETRHGLHTQPERISIAEAIFSLSMALFGLTALTQRGALLSVGLVSAVLGFGTET